jgi:hypothetical protein
MWWCCVSITASRSGGGIIPQQDNKLEGPLQPGPLLLLLIACCCTCCRAVCCCGRLCEQRRRQAGEGRAVLQNETSRAAVRKDIQQLLCG